MANQEANPDSRQGSDTGPRPRTYLDATISYKGTAGARERYDELADRERRVRLVAGLHARGEYDPVEHSILQAAPLTTDEHLELLAAGEMLARYYRHPTQLDHAVKAGATWAQIAAATGQAEAQTKQEYREWADGQHQLYRESDRFGLDASTPTRCSPNDRPDCAR